MLLPALLALASVTLADPRVFASRGSKDCQACLSEVEGKCRGPTSSSQFNDCFCSIGEEGLAWPALEKCVSGQEAKCTQDIQYDILGDWGAHCFAYKKDEEEEVCVDSTQNNKLLMSVADVFCTEFLTLSTSSTVPTPTSTGTSSEATTTGTDKETRALTTPAETKTSSPVTTTAPASTTAESNSGPDAGSSGNRGDKEQGGVAAQSPLGLGPAAILALCISCFVMAL